VHKSCRAKRVERHVEHVKVCRRLSLSNRLLPTLRVYAFYRRMWLGGAVVKAFDLRLEVAGSIPAAALSSATLDKLFTHTINQFKVKNSACEWKKFLSAAD